MLVRNTTCVFMHVLAACCHGETRMVARAERIDRVCMLCYVRSERQETGGGVVPHSPLGGILHVDVDWVLRRGMHVGRH